ncbi:hypothetical protein QTP70_001536 [Hemibagrus guttatus]|uniref:ribonuclease H n=1 Tax=Hemibagrus guttatus TaxID=175788 RepID=A0AAE0QHY1_9TELE|nr:hypothetical protein QTP70_001536 [Hemibagrus guttatus]
MYERSRTVVRCAVGQTEEFKVEVGLHQGSALSPFLFAIVMDQLSEEVRQESPWTIMFADDIVICSESREQVEENLERWRFALERRGMKVSRSKTEYMCVNEREGSGTVRLQGEEVKKVQEFKYLGSTVQSNGECGKEVKKRVQAGWNGWRKVSGVLCDRKISARIKGKVYRTVVRPAMLYGLETVSLRKRQESELEVAELKMLRFSLGVTRLDRIRNEYIRGTAHVGRLGDKVRETRLRWFGHVQRRENNATCPAEALSADYLIEFEISAVDETVLSQVRNILENTSLPLISRNVSITDINITTDNATCPAEALSADYLIEFEISAVDETVLSQVRNILENTSLPLISRNVSITDINITTADYLIELEIDLPFLYDLWNISKTINLTSVKLDFNITDINLTTDNATCPAEPVSADYLIEFEISAVDETVLSQVRNILENTSLPLISRNISITDINITTDNSTCPADPFPAIQRLSFSLVINEDFNFELADKSSEKHNSYKAKIENSINKSYSTVPGYQANSATVTEFRPGSVIADFNIQATSANLDLVSANQNLASSLRSQGFNVSDNAFSYSGQYACTTIVNSLHYVIWQIITIQQYPNIQVSTDKTVQYCTIAKHPTVYVKHQQ